jgi:phage terminase small subunit
MVRVERRAGVPEWLPRSLLNEFRRKRREMERRKLVKDLRRPAS